MGAAHRSCSVLVGAEAELLRKPWVILAPTVCLRPLLSTLRVAPEPQVTPECAVGLAQLSGGRVRISDRFGHRSLIPIGENRAEVGGKRSFGPIEAIFLSGGWLVVRLLMPLFRAEHMGCRVFCGHWSLCLWPLVFLSREHGKVAPSLGSPVKEWQNREGRLRRAHVLKFNLWWLVRLLYQNL